MPEIGDIKKAKDLGHKGRGSFIWHPCSDCGKTRWVKYEGGKPVSLRCCSCAKRGERHPLYGLRGELAPGWKGGECLCNGYIMVYMPEHPRAYKGCYMKRARIVLEQKLGRYLIHGMDSHHKNGRTTDDSPENLEEITHGGHSALHDVNKGRDFTGRFRRRSKKVGYINHAS